MPTEQEHSRQLYNEQFREAYARLNKAQQRAVDQIDGPVLVLAGPGTGKTHMLSARVGKILMETDARPYNILCLTFSDAGAHAMRQRLLQFIGPESHRVHIFTFHSFCNAVIQSNLDYFGWADLEPLGDLERIELMQVLMDDLPFSHELKKNTRDPYFYIRHLQHLFRLMKQEGWPETYVQRQIKMHLDSLGRNPDFLYQRNYRQHKKGEVRRPKLQAEQRRMKKLEAGAALFPEYEHILQKRRRYDYEDMIRWVVDTFHNNESLLRRYQEQYLYVLVDEYQDTNGAQNQLLFQLISYWDNPNVFIVGDDDQSIYEFQGARLKNLKDFINRYRKALTMVVLKENYRSSPSILGASGRLIRHNENRIIRIVEGLDKELIPAHPEYGISSQEVKLLEYPNDLQELAAVVGQIEELRRQDVPLHTVAILYPRHSQAQDILSLLKKKGIPYQVKKDANVLREPLVRQFLQLLAYLSEEWKSPCSGDQRLPQILHYPFFGIDPAAIARLGVKLQQARGPALWRELLLAGRETAAPEEPALRQAGHFFHQVLTDLAGQPLPAIMEGVISRSGLLHYVLHHPDKAWLLQQLHTVLAFAEREIIKDPALDLERFLELIRQMEHHRLQLPATHQSGHAEGVQLLSAHASKGLEFHRVFLIDCVQDYWEPSNRTSAYRFSLPETLTFSGETDALEARRRLFYVSMTRAQEHLHISYGAADEKGKPRQRTRFIDELALPGALEVEKKIVAPEAVLETQAMLLAGQAPPVVSLVEDALLDDILAGFRLSISALNAYLKCPLGFYYEHVLRLPVVRTEGAVYGAAIHYALQKFFEKMKRTKSKVFPTARQLIRFFEEDMIRHRGHFSRQQFEHKLSWGRRNLSEVYKSWKDRWEKEVLLEYCIANVEVEGVPLKGVIDKIESDGPDHAHIVDYKTGRVAAAQLASPGERFPNGGPFWRQLVFYKILYEGLGREDRTVRKGSIQYMDPDPKGEYPFRTLELGMEDSRQVTEMIRETWKQIVKRNYQTGCGKQDCRWCRLLSQRQIEANLADEELIALDDL